jgi:hypothetical protein
MRPASGTPPAGSTVGSWSRTPPVQTAEAEQRHLPSRVSLDVVATSLGDGLPDLGPHVKLHLGTVLTTAEGVALGAALGVTLGSLLTYFLQHHVQLQHAQATGIVTCRGAPVAGADVVLVGEYGPAANAVFAATTGADGSWALSVAPGLYSATVQPPGGPQVPAGILQADSGQAVAVAWAGC